MFALLSYSSSFGADAHGTDALTVLNLNQGKDPAGILPVVGFSFLRLLKFLDTSRQRQTDKHCWTEN